jgi:hypothetical protein
VYSRTFAVHFCIDSMLDNGYRTQALAIVAISHVGDMRWNGAWSDVQGLESTSEYLLEPAGAWSYLDIAQRYPR